MTVSIYRRSREALLSRVNRRFRSSQRSFTETFAGAHRIRFKVPHGNLTIVGIPGADNVRIDVDVRSRSAQLAEQMHTTIAQSPEHEALEIAFDGPFTIDRNTAASVDVVAYVPASADIHVYSAMGAVNAEGLAGTLEVHTSMGPTDVELASNWDGRHVNIVSRMGNVRFSIPRAVRLQINAQASMGKQRVEAPSFAEAPTAFVRCGMGNVVVRSI